MLSKKSVLAVLLGAAVGGGLAFLIQVPVIGLLWFVLGGVVAVVFQERLSPKSVNLGGGTLLGLSTGFLMSVAVAGMTLLTTGIKTLEFTLAVTTFPVIICFLSTVSGFLTAVCLRYLRT
jgi:hypothetical protein